MAHFYCVSNVNSAPHRLNASRASHLKFRHCSIALEMRQYLTDCASFGAAQNLPTCVQFSEMKTTQIQTEKKKWKNILECRINSIHNNCWPFLWIKNISAYNIRHLWRISIDRIALESNCLRSKNLRSLTKRSIDGSIIHSDRLSNTSIQIDTGQETYNVLHINIGFMLGIIFYAHLPLTVRYW